MTVFLTRHESGDHVNVVKSPIRNTVSVCEPNASNDTRLWILPVVDHWPKHFIYIISVNPATHSDFIEEETGVEASKLKSQI
jgi:hypothetical protein